MSKSKLVDYTKISPNSSARTAKISKITIHHMAGNLSVETCANVFQDTSRQASSNYGIGTDGRIGLYVDESRRAWTSSNRDNDNCAVTIEVANDGGSPNWHVSDKALEATIALCVDICQRNGIAKLNYTGDKSGNLTMHKWFASTLCPGPYLESKFPHIAEEVNRRLSTVQNNSATTDTGANEKPDSGASDGVLWCVQIGAYTHKKTAETRAKSAEAEGFEFSAVESEGMYKVQSKGYANKADANKLLSEVKKAGFTAFVNTRAADKASTAKKSVSRIAQEVIWGQWGNGADRKKKLTAAGYDYDEVQNMVNKLLGK
jgi:hypothetical protein